MVTFENKDYERWTTFRMGKKSYLSREEFDMVAFFHSKYQKHSFYLPCTCSPKVIKQWIKDLNVIWDRGNAEQLLTFVNNSLPQQYETKTE